MITRTLDATFLNQVANDPEIRRWLGPPSIVGDLDLSALISNPMNITLQAEHGGWVLEAKAPGVYDLHTLFLKEGRGRAYYVAAKEALRWVFTRTDATEILTKCPDDNGGARMAAASMGFRERFRREDAWMPGVGISYRAFTIDDWFIRDAEALPLGRKFHEQLEAAKAKAGSPLPVHDEDEAHDRAVGASALMMQAGMVAKGVAFYNRWASFAGYGLIAMVGPGMVDVQDAIVAVEPHGMRVLLVR